MSLAATRALRKRRTAAPAPQKKGARDTTRSTRTAMAQRGRSRHTATQALTMLGRVHRGWGVCVGTCVPLV